MIPGMIANGVAGFCNPSHEVRVPLCSLADHEKGCAGLMLLQDVEQTGRGFRVRPVIEGESSDGILG